MPSLRQKVTTYFRQLSFIADPREGGGHRTSRKQDDGNFITKYLEGRMERIFTPGPDINHGKEPNDLPNLPVGYYPIGSNTITAACTGPEEGLVGIKRSKLHLSVGSDIDFIDTIQDQDFNIRRSVSSHKHVNKFSQIQASQKNYRSDQNANKTAGISIGAADSTARDTNSSQVIRSRKNSRSDLISSNGTAVKTNAVTISKTENDNIINENNLKLSNENSQTNEGIDTGVNSGSPVNTATFNVIVSMVSTKSVPIENMNRCNSSPNKTESINSQSSPIIAKPKTGTTPAAAMTGVSQPLIINNQDDEKENSSPNEFNSIHLRHTSNHNHLRSQNVPDHNNEEIEILTQTVQEGEFLERQQSFIIAEPDEIGVIVDENNFILSEPIASVTNWKMESDNAYGISISLYEYNMLTQENVGNPIADCYGLVARGSSAMMALADGVNWGESARLAARCAIQGCLEYLDKAIFGIAQECMATTTKDVFISLLRSIWEAHGCILEVGGALSTLTVAVVLPLGGQHKNKYVVCSCNVGDSLGYVYSKKHGVRELTQGSHDITSMRDMRDALGALGPVDGNKPELSNLTLSMTSVESGDIVFLTSDGVSDNFDPVVGKFAEAWSTETKMARMNPGKGTQKEYHLAPKRQNKSTSAIHSSSRPLSTATKQATDQPSSSSSSKQRPHSTYSNLPLNSASGVPNRPPRTKKSPTGPASGNSEVSFASKAYSSGVEKSSSSSSVPSRPKYMRSHTVIEPRIVASSSVSSSPGSSHHRSPINKIPRSAAGLPLVTGPQRHTLTLLRLEDLLSYGINGSLQPCSSAKQLCHLLMDFVKMITSARRKTLEQRELFYKLVNGQDGVKREVELNRIQHRAARKRIVDSNAFLSLPGKLDHASVVAFTVGSGLQTTEFRETDF